MKPTKEQLNQFIRALPGPEQGVYWHNLAAFIDGDIKLRRKSTVIAPLALPLNQLGGLQDVRAVMPHHYLENDLIPMLVFVEASKVAQVDLAPDASTKETECETI